MGICWYCHWGWPKKIYDIYKKYSSMRACPDLDFGPGHIVWSDENFDDASIKYCINACSNSKGYYNDYTEKGLSLIKESLIELLNIPENERCVEPDNYDDEHPEKYPPPKHIEMHLWDRK